MELNGPAFVFAGMVLYMLARAKGVLLRFHLGSVTLLLGALFFLLSEMLHLMPTLIIGDIGFTISLLIGLLTAMLLRTPAMQLAALAGGMLLGEGLGLYMHRGSGEPALGSAALVDLWWLSAFITRGSSIMLELLLISLRKALRALNDAWRIR
ncbi:hypothetical protein WMW72_05785 [Paenibacillus filicis]|uniref:DUF4203 domain-containing protein n=2 Tax=Paenibacillus filicis TaxID=669464 RepID=A0ABU9DF12_9BACL